MRVLVTGASGFLGKALAERIITERVFMLRTAGRRYQPQLFGSGENFRVGEMSADTDWSNAVSSVDVVVHAAARAHIMKDKVPNPLAEFMRVNTEGSLNLATQSAQAGVRRFIFISSIKVNGEGTLPGRPFEADDVPAPLGPYAISKHNAEEGLKRIATSSDMEVVIVRPPLIYGPGVKASFLSLMNWIYQSRPLPLGAVRNKRSLVALDNLIDLIVTCIDHPAAANEIFLVSDGEDLSIPELVRRLGTAVGNPARLFPLPSWVLEAGAVIVGKRAMAQRLLGSLQVDMEKTCSILNWHPPRSVDEALQDTGQYFLDSRKV